MRALFKVGDLALVLGALTLACWIGAFLDGDKSLRFVAPSMLLELVTIVFSTWVFFKRDWREVIVAAFGLTLGVAGSVATGLALAG